jgi:sugar lactone lactonase YvrE
MKNYICLLLLGSAFTANAQTHRLTKIWETDTIVAIPESVLPDFSKKILYVSLIEGGGWDADGKGGVAKLSLDGKQYDSTWITGLNAPKGLGRYGNKMYAADISEVVVIDIQKGKVIKKIAVPDAKGLNDITVTNNGIVYVSDSKTSRIWRIENDIPALYLENIRGANGLKAIKDDLIFAEGKTLAKTDPQKKITVIAELPQSIDGIEPVGNGDFLATAWVGYIFYVHANGKTEELLDTHLQKKNTADLGYDPEKRILYVPSFNGKTVAAYQLQ